MQRAVALCCCLCVSAPALAASARPAKPSSLQRAQKLVDRLRYKDALPALLQAVDDASLDPAAHREALALLGTVQVILDDEPAARATFARLLGEDPAHRLDDSLSPKILDVYESVRLQLYPPLRVVLEAPLQLVEQGDRAAIELGLSRQGEGEIHVELHLRDAGADRYTVQPMTEQQPGRFRVELGTRPAAAQGARALEAWSQVTGPDGVVLASSGDAGAPIALQLRPLPPPPPDEDGTPGLWLWVGAGTGAALLLAGVTVTTVILLNLPPEEPQTSLGTYSLD